MEKIKCLFFLHTIYTNLASKMSKDGYEKGNGSTRSLELLKM